MRSAGKLRREGENSFGSRADGKGQAARCHRLPGVSTHVVDLKRGAPNEGVGENCRQAEVEAPFTNCFRRNGGDDGTRTRGLCRDRDLRVRN